MTLTILGSIVSYSLTRRFGNIILSRFLLNLREAQDRGQGGINALSGSSHVSRELGALDGSPVFAVNPDGLEGLGADDLGSAEDGSDILGVTNGLSSNWENVNVRDDGNGGESETVCISH